MKYYVGDDYRTINIQPKKDKVDEGMECIVYKKGDYVFKIYKNRSAYHNSKQLKLQLAQINTKRIVMPCEMVYKDSKKDDVKHYVGYTSRYVRPGNKSIHLMSTHKIYENFGYLSEDFELLNKNGIIAGDTHIDNVIFDKNDHMFIVDIGNFGESIFEEMLKVYNRNAFHYMVKSVLLENEAISDEDKVAISRYLQEKLQNTSALKFLEMELCKYSTVGEYQEYLTKKIIRSK